MDKLLECAKAFKKYLLKYDIRNGIFIAWRKP